MDTSPEAPNGYTGTKRGLHMATKAEEPGKGFERRVARGVIERHSIGCNYGTSKRCGKDCHRTYQARVSRGGRGAREVFTRSFATAGEASAWVESVRRGADPLAMDGAEVLAPTLGKATADFLRRALSGEVRTRSGTPYSRATVDNYEGTLRRHVLPYRPPRFRGRRLGDVRADEITTQTIQGLVDALAVQSSGTARLADAAIRAVLRDLYRQELIPVVPTAPVLPAPPQGRDAYLTQVQADALLAAAREDDQARRTSLMAPIVALLWGAGPRISELLRLTWGPSGVDISGPTVTVQVERETTKTEAGARRVGLEDWAGAILREHYMASGRPEDGAWVFPGDSGDPLPRHGAPRSGLARITKAARQSLMEQLEGVRAAAGYPPEKDEPPAIAALRAEAEGLRAISIGPHLFRHSHASAMADAGYSATEIAARIGHSDPAFTQRRYIHPNRARVAEAPDRLAEWRERERQRSAG